MQPHEIISELIITNNKLSVLLEFLIDNKEMSIEYFNKECKDNLEISYPFDELKSINKELRNKIQDYLKVASETRYNT